MREPDIKEDEAAKLRAELDEAMEILRTIFPSDCFLNASEAIRKRAEDLLARHQSETPKETTP